jgi:hypothetical protein
METSPRTIRIMVFTKWTTKAKIIPFSLEMPYNERDSLVIKCQVPKPPWTGASIPKLPITKVVRAEKGDNPEVKSKAKNEK